MILIEDEGDRSMFSDNVAHAAGANWPKNGPVPICFLEPHAMFDGFGPGGPAPWWPADTHRESLEGDRLETRRLIRGAAPPRPGVYGMVDAAGELIYVGKSKCLRDRLLSYCAAAAPDKARQIITRARHLVWETAPDEFASLVRELELIRRWRPALNVQGQPNRLRSTYIVLGRRPAPYVYLAASAGDDRSLVVGPVRPGRHCQEAVRVLNDCLRLRTCSERIEKRFSDQPELFAADRTPQCLRHELGLCLAPCAARCSSREYGEQVRAAMRFLTGQDTALLDELETAMLEAAAARRYEQAAVLRNQWLALDGLHARLERLRQGRRRDRVVYPTIGHDGRVIWYLLRQGRVAASLPEPRTARQARQCLAMFERVYPPGGPRVATEVPEDPEMLLLTAGFFHRRPEELRRTFTPQKARRWLRRLAE